jgi:hypothetical protein
MSRDHDGAASGPKPRTSAFGSGADPETARFEALLSAMVDIVCVEGAERLLDEDPARLFAKSGLGASDAEALTALGARRLFIYRRHVRKVLARGIQRQIPRTAARLGDAFDRWVARWIEADPPRSRYFRDAAFEMVAWASPRWQEDPDVPDFIVDLARYELCWFEVITTPSTSADDAEGVDLDLDLDLDKGARFDDAVRLARFDHAVQRLPEAEEARDVPAREPTAILVYRDDEHDARFLELTPRAAEILSRLLAGATLREAVVGGASALGHAVDAGVTQGTAALLEDLRARGALRGGRAA